MEVSNKSLTLQLDPSKPNIPTVVVLDCLKAYKEIGWAPTIDIKEGLKKTCEWYLENYK